MVAFIWLKIRCNYFKGPTVSYQCSLVLCYKQLWGRRSSRNLKGTGLMRKIYGKPLHLRYCRKIFFMKNCLSMNALFEHSTDDYSDEDLSSNRNGTSWQEFWWQEKVITEASNTQMVATKNQPGGMFPLNRLIIKCHLKILLTKSIL